MYINFPPMHNTQTVNWYTWVSLFKICQIISCNIIRMLTNHTFALTTPSWNIKLLDKYYQMHASVSIKFSYFLSIIFFLKLPTFLVTALLLWYYEIKKRMHFHLIDHWLYPCKIGKLYHTVYIVVRYTDCAKLTCFIQFFQCSPCTISITKRLVQKHQIQIIGSKLLHGFQYGLLAFFIIKMLNPYLRRQENLFSVNSWFLNSRTNLFLREILSSVYVRFLYIHRHIWWNAYNSIFYNQISWMNNITFPYALLVFFYEII